VYKEDWNQNYDPFSLSHRFLKIITRLTNHDLNMKLNTISINCTFVKKDYVFRNNFSAMNYSKWNKKRSCRREIAERTPVITAVTIVCYQRTMVAIRINVGLNKMVT